MTATIPLAPLLASPTSPARLLLMLALCCAWLPAQEPKDPPPWWGIADEDTVSLHWDFNNPLTPLAPTQQILPSWYVPLPTAGNNFGFTNSANIVWIPTLAGNTGVMGFTGAGTGTISALIENDFRPYWIKIFFMQFDSFAAGASKVTAAVAKDLIKYQRGIIEEKSEALPGGWTRTTLGMYLIPQPVNEKLDFSLTEAALNSVAIDNLFVNSKCVKPPPDEKGLALGEVEAQWSFNVGAATGNAACTAVCATEDQSQVLTFWVAGRTGATNDQVFRLDPTGVQVGTSIPLPTPAAAFGGASDLAVARVPQPGPLPVRTFVYGVLDRRQSNGTVALFGIDADLATPAIVPTLQITLNTGIPGPGPLALAYSPHGDLGRGTFWITDQAGNVVEVTRLGGVILRTLTATQNNIPLGISGAAYDPMTAHFYWFTSLPTPTPQGVTQIALFEHDGYSLLPTGVQFLADRSLPNPGGPPGGIAHGLEVLRRDNGDFRLLCVQQAGTQTFLRVLRGPWQYGWSLLGRIGMRGGLPMQGNPGWQVTLRGVPNATNAICFIGFDNLTHLSVPLPVSLAGLGMDESRLSISPLLQSSILPVLNGNASFNVQLPPPGTLPSNTPVFFQWAVFDPTVVTGIAASQAGKTVIY